MSVEIRRGFSFRETMGKEYGIAQRGVIFSCAVSVVIILLSLPVFNWVTIVNAENLYTVLTKAKVDLLHGGYTLFNLLSFVGDSGAGALGLPAMLLLLLMVATLYFHLAFIVRTLFRRSGDSGVLGHYSSAQTSMVLSLITNCGTIAFMIFANSQFRSSMEEAVKKNPNLFGDAGAIPFAGFALSPIVYIIPVLALAAYCCTKTLEKPARKKNHEHGFFMEVKKNWILFLFLIPCFIYIMINNYLPMAGAYFAFIKFNFTDGLFASPYVGFNNFQFLLGDNLWRLARNTVLYNVAFIGLGNVLQIVFAILVSQVVAKWFKRTSQTLIFMPYFVSFVILRVLVYNLFEYKIGAINNLITALGGERVDFYNDASYWPWFIIIFYIWKNLGYGMVIYLATIMGISDDYYDAAKVDGANILQQIRFITLPHLFPTFIILLLYALGSIMRGQFELFYQLIGLNGTLYSVSDIFDTYVYRVAMSNPLGIGLGTAAGLFQSLFGLIIIVCTNFLIRRKHAEYALF